VDDRPYGGGPGMVLKPEPLSKCIDDAKETGLGPVVYLSPQGERLDQNKVQELSELDGMILVCGRYEGIDERIIDSRVDLEISIGDYVLAGGEMPAMVMIDAIARLLPGVLGNSESAIEDSFSSDLLDCPHFTRPEEFEGMNVPEVLLSGDHEKIKRWRHNESMKRTEQRRPDLLKKRNLINE
jgi:tRNA (guanine37-N1)-methyltransferase